MILKLLATVIPFTLNLSTLTVIESIPGASTVKWLCSMTAAQMAPTSKSPPKTEMRWALQFRSFSTSPMKRSSLRLAQTPAAPGIP